VTCACGVLVNGGRTKRLVGFSPLAGIPIESLHFSTFVFRACGGMALSRLSVSTMVKGEGKGKGTATNLHHPNSVAVETAADGDRGETAVFLSLIVLA
jgi:hypothetical protein